MPRGRAIFYIVVISLASAVTAVLLTMRFHSAWPEGDVALLSTKQYTELTELKRLRELSDLIVKESVKERSREDNYDSAARGMVAGLDDKYAAYYTNEQYERITERQRGEYSGIGCTIDYEASDSRYAIVAVLKGSPSEEAGLRVGDILVKVDGMDCRDMPQEELVAHVRGEEGTIVTLTVQRDGVDIDLPIKRAHISTEHVKYRMLDNGIGVVRLTDFTGPALDEFDKAIAALEKDKMKALIIDLRDNPGGNLETVVTIADELLDGGEILTVRPRQGDAEVFSAKPGKLGLPLAVIINENSASASEVLAGAIQDSKTGTIVGVRSFGKGSVQTTYPLNEGGWVKFTTAEYFTPSGRSVQDAGIIPDVAVEMERPPEGTGFEDLPLEQDSQLRAAIDIVTGN